MPVAQIKFRPNAKLYILSSLQSMKVKPQENSARITVQLFCYMSKFTVVNL